uniref:C2H2-type domain-containing protein n=1 Tax=Riboviria sp. TaxID=2585031 RepID=A0A8K1U2G9_9VIRU|nr:MAG: hypothetical protein 2 [Riboviria sp.]
MYDILLEVMAHLALFLGMSVQGLAAATFSALLSLVSLTVYTVKMSVKEDPPPLTRYQKFKADWVVPSHSFVYEVFLDFITLDWAWIFTAIATTIFGMLMAFSVLRSVLRLSRKKVLKFRGVYDYAGESVRAGSIFATANIPRFQVEILLPGLLIDTFVGYGCRLNDHLVVPGHVYDLTGGEFILQTQAGKVLVKPPVQRSAIISDIVYAVIDISVWTTLQVAKPTCLKDRRGATQVSVTGKKGRAVGTISHSNVPFLYNFTGSTLPGYSGAAYVYNGALIGVHLGVAGSNNVGICAEVLLKDIQSALRGEAGIPTAISANMDRELLEKERSSKDWNVSDYDRYEEIDPEDDEAWEIFEDYTQQGRGKTFIEYSLEKLGREPRYVKAGGNYTGEAAREIQQMQDDTLISTIHMLRQELATRRSKKAKDSLKIVGHSDDSMPAFTLTVDPAQLVEQRLQSVEEKQTIAETHINNINAQIEVLNNQMTKLIAGKTIPTSKPNPPIVHPFGCSKCAKSFKTEVGRLCHTMTVHKDTATETAKVEVRQESAIKSDHQKLVATTSKNGKGSSSKSSSTKSLPISKSLAGPIPSTSAAVNPSKTETSDQKLDRLCDLLEMVIRGLPERRDQS